MSVRAAVTRAVKASGVAVLKVLGDSLELCAVSTQLDGYGMINAPL